MKKYIKNYFKSPISEESLLKYQEMIKQTYHSFGLGSSSIKVKVLIALAATLTSIGLAYLRGLIN